jgi:hypothetical protein
MTSIHKIKYESTSSHNKICNNMNATNTIVHLNRQILEFYSFVKIKELHYATVIYLWLTRFCRCYHVTTGVGQSNSAIESKGKKDNLPVS